MDLISKSIEIAIRAHAGQFDKSGESYILHPLRVMHKLKSEEEICTAILHDVIEDSNISENELLIAGIPPKIVTAVKCLSRIKNETYEDFINRVLQNELAIKIKHADIEDNMNLMRLTSLTDADVKRIKKYHKAWMRLSRHIER